MNYNLINCADPVYEENALLTEEVQKLQGNNFEEPDEDEDQGINMM